VIEQEKRRIGAPCRGASPYYSSMLFIGSGGHADIKGTRPPNAGKDWRGGAPDKISESLGGMILADIRWIPGGCES
jgi:hypothetical protein